MNRWKLKQEFIGKASKVFICWIYLYAWHQIIIQKDKNLFMQLIPPKYFIGQSVSNFTTFDLYTTLEKTFSEKALPNNQLIYLAKKKVM